MKILESAPHRYDLGMRVLSFGRIADMYRTVAAAAVGDLARPRVLEIGCGTGGLTRCLLEAGAEVVAIDFNPDMLAVAQAKLGDGGGHLELREMAAVEIGDRLAAGSFDAVVAALALSEMGNEEQVYVLRAARSALRPGGRLVVADEVRPPGWWGRMRRACVRWPLTILTYALTQTTTAALSDLTGVVTAAGFRIVREQGVPGGIGLVTAERPMAERPMAERPEQAGA